MFSKLITISACLSDVDDVMSIRSNVLEASRVINAWWLVLARNVTTSLEIVR